MTTLNQKNKQIEKQPLEYYLNLQYPVTLYPDQEGGYVAQIKDLPGCLTQGETLDEAIANINEARELWIETAYEAGDEIPLPSTLFVLPQLWGVDFEKDDVFVPSKGL